MNYKYKAINEIGEKFEGDYKAESQVDVLAMLKKNNYFPITIEENKSINIKLEFFSQKVTKKDIFIFCRQFSTMLNAGVDIIDCLEVLEKQIENKTLKEAVFEIHKDLQKGIALSEGLKRYPEVFPDLLINMVEVGEVSGNLHEIMERMAIHFEKEGYIENKVKNALVYPILLSVISLGVVIFLLTVVMPIFTSMFEDSGSILPGSTRILLAISNWIVAYWYLFIGIIVFAIFAIISFGKTNFGRLFYDGLKIKIPILKTMNINIITARFTRTLSTLMASGIPLLEALDVVGKVVGNMVVSNGLATAKEEIKKGIYMSEAIKDRNIFPPMVDSMISVGEESGSVSDLLYKTADFYEEEVETSIGKMTTMLEPILIVFMSIIVGFIVISIAMPMFDMVNTMQI